MTSVAIAQPRGGGNYGWTGPGMMYGYGPAGSGWGPQRQGNLDLSVADAKNNTERWVQSGGNPHIKVRNVEVKDADTITADIVTKDKDALEQRYEINRHTGFMGPAG